MPTRSTSHHHYSIGIDNVIQVIAYSSKRNPSFLSIESSSKTIFNGSWLFMYFFEHEVVVSSFFQCFEMQFQFFDIGTFQFFDFVVQLHPFVLIQNRYIAVVQVDHLLGIFNNRGGIRGHIKIIFFTDSHHQWAAFACGHQFVLGIFAHHNNGISSNDLLQS